MSRYVPVALALVAVSLAAAEPNPLDKTLAIQRAMAEAKAFLAANQPADATQSLEAVLADINGDADFLALLRQAYGEELKKRKLARTPDAERIANLEGKLAILNNVGPKSEASPVDKPKAELPKAELPKAELPKAELPKAELPKAELPKAELPKAELPKAELPKAELPKAEGASELLKRAGELFNSARTQPANYAEADRLFQEARDAKAEFSTDQFAAWSYCRVRLAADRWNRSKRDAAATADAARAIEDALAMAPEHADLQAAGRKLIADVGGRPSAAKPKRPAIAEERWAALESDNFRIRFQGSADDARGLLTKAEAARRAIFARWTSPAATNWQPKCDIVWHANAAEYAAATNGPAGNGHAFVKLSDKRVTERRLDLRADDAAVADDALPRELTHVILADLFPDRDPPKWAAIGMAVLATATEADRCQRTLARCHRAGELYAIPAFLDLKGPPKPEAVTAYYVESASVVEHLVKRKDAKTFRIFLLDAARYGLEKALDRQYGYASLQAFDDDWRRSALATARGQKP